MVIRVADMKEAKGQTSVTIFRRRSSAVKKINRNCPTSLLVPKLLQTMMAAPYDKHRNMNRQTKIFIDNT